MSGSVDRQVETTPYRKVLVYTMIMVCKQELLLLELLSFQAACIAWFVRQSQLFSSESLSDSAPMGAGWCDRSLDPEGKR
jgi:hypothetical protein